MLNTQRGYCLKKAKPQWLFSNVMEEIAAWRKQSKGNSPEKFAGKQAKRRWIRNLEEFQDIFSIQQSVIYPRVAIDS